MLPASLNLEFPACPVCASTSRRMGTRLGPAYVAQCLSCRLHYAYPRLSQQALNTLYRENPSPLSPERNAMLTRLMAGRANQIQTEAWPGLLAPKPDPKPSAQSNQNQEPSPTWLELGCGFGHCLAQVQKWGYQVQGTELSEAQANFAKDEFGLSIYRNDLFAQAWPQTFDVIASFEVIEHVTEPQLWLQWAFNHLKPGGQCILSTPNYRSLYRYILGRHWYYHIPTQHLIYYTPKTILQGLTQAGFKKIRVYTSGRSLMNERNNAHNRYEPQLTEAEQWQANFEERGRIEFLRETTASEANEVGIKRIFDSLGWHLGRWAGRFGFGDQMRVYAQK